MWFFLSCLYCSDFSIFVFVFFFFINGVQNKKSNARLHNWLPIHTLQPQVTSFSVQILFLAVLPYSLYIIHFLPTVKLNCYSTTVRRKLFVRSFVCIGKCSVSFTRSVLQIEMEISAFTPSQRALLARIQQVEIDRDHSIHTLD